MNLTEELSSDYYNIQAEYLFVGSLYKDPDIYLLYGDTIRSTYDFYDDATRFFYEMFVSMRKTFSEDMSERNVNTFATMDDERYKIYSLYQGYRTIKMYMESANVEDAKSYYNTIKKYSVIREYLRKGFPVDKIVKYKNFSTLTPEEIPQIIIASASKINTIILCEKESVIVNSKMEETQKRYLIAPQLGLLTPWEGYNALFRGCREGKVIFDGMLSNEGKTRKMMQLAAYITLIQDESFLLMSNEMSEEDLRSCLLATVLNNEQFKLYHGVDIIKKEEEIVLGQYIDDTTGKFMSRLVDENGKFLETEDEYCQRVYNNSSEYRKVMQVSKWIDIKRQKNLLFLDVGKNYSDKALETQIKKHKELYGVKYVGYDTLKGYRTDDWQSVKQTATMLKELMKNENMFLYAVFQLTDDTAYCDVFDLTSNNIANAKQIKHVADHLVLNLRIHADDYGKYEYIPFKQDVYWGETEFLDPKKVYYGAKIDKNRAADKSKLLLFEVNLDYNTWENVGVLLQKKK